MSYNPTNPNGQATSANSSPVVLASDQSAINSNISKVGGSSIALGATTGASSLPVTIATDYFTDTYITGASAQTAAVNNILPASSGATATDALGYRSGSVQVTSTGTAGTFIFEGSNDNTNFQSIPVWNQLILTGTPITAAITASASQLIYTFPINFRYVRLRIATTITGGSIQAFTKLSQAPWTPAINQIAQATAGNLNVNVGTLPTLATVSSVTQSATALPVYSNPIASAAITTTTTTALAPTNGTAVVFQLNVTAVSGTTPTMDVAILESFDNATSYTQTIYQFPRVTGVLATPLFSPPIRLTGAKIEVVQTITGTTPSFTRALFMNQMQSSLGTVTRQIYDRTVTLTTLSSTTATLYSQNTGTNVQLDINIGAATTPPALQLQVSNDGGGSWISIGSPLTAVASSTVTAVVASTSATLVRAIVTTAGSGVTAGYVLLRTF